MRTRNGYTLIEVLVMIAILGILVGLVLGAIQKVREQAVKAQSANNIRQILIGMHNYTTAYESKLPGVANAMQFNGNTDTSILLALVPFIESESKVVLPTPVPGEPLIISRQMFEQMYPRRKVFISPGDPSLADFEQVLLVNGTTGETEMRSLVPPTSYAANMTTFEGLPNLYSSIPDGTSNTIAFAERYTRSYRFRDGVPPQWASFSYIMGTPPNPPGDYHGERRPSFADRAWDDTIPKAGSSGTQGSRPNQRPFQVRPRLQEADATVPQSPFSGGLLVGMFDGSVRMVSESVSESVFWSAVTPNGGEITTLD